MFAEVKCKYNIVYATENVQYDNLTVLEVHVVLLLRDIYYAVPEEIKLI